MTLADQAVITAHDGEVTSGRPERPKRRTFTAAYKARILVAYHMVAHGGHTASGDITGGTGTGGTCGMR